MIERLSRGTRGFAVLELLTQCRKKRKTDVNTRERNRHIMDAQDDPNEINLLSCRFCSLNNRSLQSWLNKHEKEPKKKLQYGHCFAFISNAVPLVIRVTGAGASGFAPSDGF